MFRKERLNKRGMLAVSQIIILILGVIAIGYAIGSEVGEAEAQGAYGAAIIAARKAKEATAVAKVGTWGKLGGWIQSHQIYAALIGTAVLAGIAFAITGDLETAGVVAKSASYGYGAGQAASFILKELGASGKLLALGPLGVGAGVFMYFLLSYKKQELEIVVFTCNAWDAPSKGTYCEECNKQGDLPCNEYQCRSLGQSCQIINKGTKEEQCVWVNRNDINPPTITPRDDALLDNYRYNPSGLTFPNKEDRGTRVIYLNSTNGCIQAFTPFSFGIDLNEPGKCKIDVTRKDNFKDMRFFFSNGISKYNHSYTIILPGTSAFENENISVKNDGNYEAYVRCQDANENTNIGNFVFKYCVQKGPDTTPPLIKATDPINGAAIPFEKTSFNVDVFTNEPADCKWSHSDKSYSDMEETMSCPSNSIFEFNTELLYKCSTKLTGLKDRQDNDFYFRCKDKSGNENVESQKFTLIGTQPLVIEKVSPNGTIKDSTEIIKIVLEVGTSAGYREGEATCSYKKSEEPERSYIKFDSTDSHRHSQRLDLPEGDYDFSIKCVDFGGNLDTETISFHVETDTEAPVVVRAFKEELNLRIITNEEAECVYSTSISTGWNYLFEPDGLSMVRTNKVNHFVEWNPNINYYIKCQDEYGNQPQPPNECSIIVKPFDIS